MTLHPIRRCDSRILGLAIPLLLASAAAAAQDATEILQQSADTYRALHGYEITGELRTTMTIDGQPQEVTWPVTLVRADSTILPADSPIPTLSQTIRYHHPSFRAVSGPPVTNAPSLTSPNGWSRFDDLDVDIENPQRLPDETLEFEGKPLECWVVELKYADKYPSRGIAGEPVRYWIERDTRLVARMTFVQPGRAGAKPLYWTFQPTTAKLNQPLPDWALQLLPQEAGHEVNAWVGRPAPPFDLASLDGNRVSLADLRGKVVLLNFWATWCSPCKEEMPVIEKLAADLGSRGLEVWGITNEAAAKARDWLDRAQRSLPTLVDTGRATFQAYEIDTIPVSVVIGRDGRVTSYVVGLRGEAALRAAVEEALLPATDASGAAASVAGKGEPQP